MNVYQKLQKARVMLQGKELSKSGKNTFAKYEYFELSDFLPHINSIFDELGLFSQVNFCEEFATLQIINTDKIEERIIFNCPAPAVEIKGANKIQAEGGRQTYTRRYLYMTALEIVENDPSDALLGKENNNTSNISNTKNNNNNTKNDNNRNLTEAQIKRLYAISNKKGCKAEQVKELVQNRLNKKVEQMTKDEYDKVVKYYEDKPDVA